MNKKSDDAKKKSGDLSNLSINDLRAKLHAKGEDFDGSKETLIAQLKWRIRAVVSSDALWCIAFYLALQGITY